jgi:guanylate kinase
MNKIKVIALFGKSASGKDSIQKWIIKSFPSATHSIISCTTRPKRDYEEDKCIAIRNSFYGRRILGWCVLYR